MTATSARVTVVVVTWNGAHLLPDCLDSLRAQTETHRVLVVDNASQDETRQLLAQRYPDYDVLRLPTNTGFAGGAQAGLVAASDEYVAFLNNDAVAEPSWLSVLVAALDKEKDVAAVTSRILLADDARINNAGGSNDSGRTKDSSRINNAGGALNRWGVGRDRGLGEPDAAPYDVSAEVAAFSGGAALLRRDVALEVGGFPQSFFLYYEDTDLSWRLRRAGWRIRYEPSAIVHHLHAASSDKSSPSFAFYNQRNQLLMLIRNAPARLVIAAVFRFLAVTAADAIRTLVPAQRSPVHQRRPSHRLKVLAAVARATPAALRDRRQFQRSSRLSRRDFCRQWLGVDSR